MTNPPEPFALADAVMHLDGVGPVAVADNGATFWADRTRPELATGHVVSSFTYTATWPYRECHPDGDELALVLSGEVDVLLDAGDGERATRVRAGQGCVVPAGWWHRLGVERESTVLFVTPVPARTRHEECAADQPRVQTAPDV